MSVHDYRDELIARYNAEECVGNLIAVVNGKREVIATYDHQSVNLTAVGTLLEAKREAAEAKASQEELEDAPVKRRGRPRKVVEATAEESVDDDLTLTDSVDA